MMLDVLKKMIWRFGGFSLIGGVVTLLSFVLIYVLNEVCGMNYVLSYVTAYIVTVLLSYILNAVLVFHSGICWKGAAGFAAAYVSGMLLGILLLRWLGGWWPEANKTLLTFLVIPVTMVWNFLFVDRIMALYRKKEPRA